ncbi:resolvase [Streptomyces sp. NPDC087859]|uniref:resolvase n=1 Tax=Streptomyces sp. NPDC087859 TaxID=3365812 RepID=UPI003828E204
MLKCLARNAAELMALSGRLQAAGMQLELLTGPLNGTHGPGGMGAMFFAVLAAAAQIERNYLRGNHGHGRRSSTATCSSSPPP